MDIPAQIGSHLLDSLSPLLWSGWPEALRALDLGSGGGLPAIPLSIIFPQWDYTLVESTGKKATFLKDVKEAINLDNIHIYNQYFGPGKNCLGQTFDLVTVRAVGELKKLAPIVAPLLSSGGYFLAFKGPQAAIEMTEASQVLKKCGLALHDEFSFNLPLSPARRNLLLFIKQ